MKELFYELIKEASIGKVEICGDDWPVSFNTNLEGKEFRSDNNYATLVINDEREFLKLLEEYVSLELQKNRKIPSFYKDPERNKMKWIMMYLFSYATTEDFINPLDYIRRKIDFLKDNSLSQYDEKVTIHLSKKVKSLDLEIEKEKNAVSMETPNRLNIQLKEENATYKLPSIYYGIRTEDEKKVCYIYSLLKPKEKEKTEQDEKLYKKVNRLLFKLNDGLVDKEDYNSKEESNIKDVSMPFVLALNIFISILQKEQIEKIKVVSYLPVTFASREHIAEERNSEELLERNQSIQENLTNKLIRTFRRLSIQNPSLQVETYPYEVDEYLTLSLNSRTKELENMLLEETSREVNEEKSK